MTHLRTLLLVGTLACFPLVAGAQNILPDSPSRTDIVSAMNSVSAAVQQCGGGEHGLAPVRMVFEGRTGLLKEAHVVGDRFSPQVRECIVRAVRTARVPQFRRERFSVNYPFRL